MRGRLIDYKAVVKGNFYSMRRFLRVKQHHLPPSLHQVVEIVPLPEERAGVAKRSVLSLYPAVLAQAIGGNRQPERQGIAEQRVFLEAIHFGAISNAFFTSCVSVNFWAVVSVVAWNLPPVMVAKLLRNFSPSCGYGPT